MEDDRGIAGAVPDLQRDQQVPLVAPTPLLIVHGTSDAALLPELAQAAYDAALGPKELGWIETHNHIELYDQDPYVSRAAKVIAKWRGTQLPATAPA